MTTPEGGERCVHAGGDPLDCLNCQIERAEMAEAALDEARRACDVAVENGVEALRERDEARRELEEQKDGFDRMVRRMAGAHNETLKELDEARRELAEVREMNARLVSRESEQRLVARQERVRAEAAESQASSLQWERDQMERARDSWREAAHESADNAHSLREERDRYDKVIDEKIASIAELFRENERLREALKIANDTARAGMEAADSRYSALLNIESLTRATLSNPANPEDESLWGEDAAAVAAVERALFGHHPERGGQERQQAAYAAVRAVREVENASEPPADEGERWTVHVCTECKSVVAGPQVSPEFRRSCRHGYPDTTADIGYNVPRESIEVVPASLLDEARRELKKADQRALYWQSEYRIQLEKTQTWERQRRAAENESSANSGNRDDAPESDLA